VAEVQERSVITLTKRRKEKAILFDRAPEGALAQGGITLEEFAS